MPSYTVHIQRHGEDIAHITDLPTPEACLAAMQGYGGCYCCLIYTDRNIVTIQFDDGSKTFSLYDGQTDRFAKSTKGAALKYIKAWLD